MKYTMTLPGLVTVYSSPKSHSSHPVNSVITILVVLSIQSTIHMKQGRDTNKFPCLKFVVIYRKEGINKVYLIEKCFGYSVQIPRGTTASTSAIMALGRRFVSAFEISNLCALKLWPFALLGV